MSLSAAQLMASAEVCVEVRRLRSVASDLTQADSVERCEGTTGVEQIVRIERGKWLLLSKRCTAIAKAMDLTAAGEAQLLLARIDRAPERRKPMPYSASIGLRLYAFAALLTVYPQGKLQEWLATLDLMAALWPQVKARQAHSSAPRRTGHEVSTPSPSTIYDSRRDA